jgi:anoctamin-10/anoctamin-7
LALFLIFCGSCGFNGVNNIPIDGDMSALGGKRMASTIIAATCSFFTMVFYHTFIEFEVHFSNKYTNYINATVSGLIAISGSCGTCEFEGAFAIGVVAAFVYIFFKYISKLSHMNEKNDVTAIYFANGAWGLLAPGFFASENGYKSSVATYYESNESRVAVCSGVFYGGQGWQLAANFAFLFAVICWSSVVIIVSLIVINGINGSLFASLPIHTEMIQEVVNKQEENVPISSLNNDEKNQLRKDWDLVIVMPVECPKLPPVVHSKFIVSPPEVLYIKDVIVRLRNCGLHVYPYFSCQNDEVLLKVSASIRRLKFIADIINYELLLDAGKVEEECQKNYPNDLEIKIKGFQISNGEEIKATSISPYKHIYAPYETEPQHQFLFANAPGLNHPLSSIHRFTLLDTIIKRKGKYFANVNIHALLKSKCILAYYPLHEKEAVKRLNNNWLSLSVMPWRQPIDDVRNYFGETVALYFHFMGHYTTWLAYLAIIGGIITIHLIINAGVYVGDLNKSIVKLYSVPILSFVLCIWTHLFLENWKKQEGLKAMEWGQTKFEDTAPVRSDFYGQEVPSYINGSPIIVFPNREKIFLTRVSRATTLMAIMGVIAVVSAIFYYRYWSRYITTDEATKNNGETISGFMNAVQINVLTLLYNSLAYYLNDSENFRTQYEYNDALIGKLFVFNFVNSFASCFYIAYIKDVIGDRCVEGSCLGELSHSLLIIFVSKLLVANVVSYCSPKLQIYLNEKKETASKDKNSAVTVMKLSTAEKEYCLLPYDGTMSDFNTISIQFGYMALFLSALPFAPILATITNFIEIRQDGHKLLSYCRRIIDRGSQDIGAWFDIFKTISDITVFTNAGLIFYTSPIFGGQSTVQ